MRLAILADDFTGALDTSVQFSSQGISTVLTSGEQPWTSMPDNCEVLTVDLQTRHLPPADVYRRVYRAAEKFAAEKRPLFIYQNGFWNARKRRGGVGGGRGELEK